MTTKKRRKKSALRMREENGADILASLQQKMEQAKRAGLKCTRQRTH